jgi:hypothetical protein
MTFSITTFRIMTLSIMGLFAALSIIDTEKNDNQHNSTLHYAEGDNTECRDYLSVMLCVVMLNVVMMNVVAP